MARARNIKPGFFTNDLIAEIPALGRLLFQGLWCHADREGRLEDRPKKIKAEILPYDDCDVDQLLNALHSRGFILRYAVDGRRYIQVVNFTKHQNPHVKESASEIPAPDEHGASTVQAPDEHGTSTEVAVLIPDSGFLIPDSPSLIPDSAPLAGGCATATPPPPPPEADASPPSRKTSGPPAKRSSALPADFEPDATGVAYAEQRSVPLAVELQAFRNHHQARGSTFRDWQAAWRTWCDKAVEFGRCRAPPGAPAGNHRPTLTETRVATIAGLTRTTSNERHFTAERDITGEAERIP